MAITIDDDTFHRMALDNGYVRLADITEFASRSLTYYMVPKYTLVVSSFPQTALR
jgi:hypothetical protein